METENSQEKKTTLVLGGTGKTGRRVVERLTARGLPTRVGSRSGEPPFDWEKRATWAPAVRDVESVYLTYYPDLAAPGAAATVRSFVELAVESGIRRLVLLSGRARKRPSAASRRYETPASTGRSCARAGSTRTSARTSCSTEC